MRVIEPFSKIGSEAKAGLVRQPSRPPRLVSGVQKQEFTMPDTKSKPAPSQTEPDKQMDDNIGDLGRKQDVSKQEQPGRAKPSK